MSKYDKYIINSLIITKYINNYFPYFVPVFKYCYSDSRDLWTRNESGMFGALKSDSTHHFCRKACTKSESLRFSQFSGCWLILSV
jgi:hypothetical protein